MELAPNPHYNGGIAKALGGSFKLVMPAPKPVRDDSTAQGNTKEWGQTNTPVDLAESASMYHQNCHSSVCVHVRVVSAYRSQT